MARSTSSQAFQDVAKWHMLEPDNGKADLQGQHMDKASMPRLNNQRHLLANMMEDKYLGFGMIRAASGLSSSLNTFAKVQDPSSSAGLAKKQRPSSTYVRF